MMYQGPWEDPLHYSGFRALSLEMSDHLAPVQVEAVGHLAFLVI